LALAIACVLLLILKSILLSLSVDTSCSVVSSANESPMIDSLQSITLSGDNSSVHHGFPWTRPPLVTASNPFPVHQNSTVLLCLAKQELVSLATRVRSAPKRSTALFIVNSLIVSFVVIAFTTVLSQVLRHCRSIKLILTFLWHIYIPCFFQKRPFFSGFSP